MKYILSCLFISLTCLSNAQEANRWQQHAQYKMEIDMDVNDHQFTGKQWLVYTNNSPDTLSRIFYHLYFNAFQPGSMMDVRSRSIEDPDGRVADRIYQLKEDEIGYQKINSLTMDGEPVHFSTVGTILEVDLPKPILPGVTTLLYMEFDAQVPMQIRRSGRNNKEGISYSMTQWYPKLCEYDYQGWHSNPYVGREFHGVWGDFDVKIWIAANYILGGSGILKNAKEIGYYQMNLKPIRAKKRLWHFRADQVHDFAWAADPDYKHIVEKTNGGVEMHFLYQEGELASENWPLLPKIMNEVFDYLGDHYGKYPYPVYSIIQGGDGGMEYAMMTLITGERKISSLVGVSVHELVHSWYQMVLGTNESLYPWMDEGFTSYVSSDVMNHLRKKGMIPGEAIENHMANSNKGFGRFALTGGEEPLSTHADHYQTNRAYGVGSYTKGSVFLSQLNYIVGDEVFERGMKRYFHTWKFRHPNVNDFIRVMEKESNLELDWYKEYMVNSTHTIDYAVDTLLNAKRGSKIVLSKKGVMPMPVDLLVEFKDGKTKLYTVPLRMMRGSKEKDVKYGQYTTLEDWPWTHSIFEFNIDVEMNQISNIKLDPYTRTADTNILNNVWPREEVNDQEE